MVATFIKLDEMNKALRSVGVSRKSVKFLLSVPFNLLPQPLLNNMVCRNSNEISCPYLHVYFNSMLANAVGLHYVKHMEYYYFLLSQILTST